MNGSGADIAPGEGRGPEGPGGGKHFKTSTTNRSLLDRVFSVLVLLAALSGIVVLGLLLTDVIRDGVPRLSLDFLTSFPSNDPAEAGVFPGLIGSLWLIVLTALISVPLGVGAAIYLEEYAEDSWINRIVEVNIANLAAVPSIVYGILGLAIFVEFLGGFTGGQSILAGALTLSLLVLPVIIIATREALRAVPDSLREGGYALGATRWEIIRSHVLPSALPGALTGTILALSRAIGETAPLIVVGAATFVTFAPPASVEAMFGRYSAMPIQIYDFISRPQAEFDLVAAASIVVVLVVLLLLNSVAIVLRNRYQRRG